MKIIVMEKIPPINFSAKPSSEMLKIFRNSVPKPEIAASKTMSVQKMESIFKNKKLPAFADSSVKTK
ncbi:hypothetical protein ACF3N7_01495 [Cruoricaptor ignavus]|uniref:hypothetical protein n=1 Tax=Cruoricaptor ignavus TaxID=1118202 RepID=UPI0009FA95AB